MHDQKWMKLEELRQPGMRRVLARGAIRDHMHRSKKYLYSSFAQSGSAAQRGHWTACNFCTINSRGVLNPARRTNV